MPVSVLTLPKVGYLVRNMEKRAYSMSVHGVPAVAVFIERADAVKMQTVLESHYHTTGMWPDLSSDSQIYMKTIDDLDKLLEIQEEKLDDYIQLCNLHYVPFILITSFDTDGNNRTLVKGSLVQREVDGQVKSYLEQVYDV